MAETVEKMNISKIANLAGVSVTTVSRVLNHPESVREETRKRVQQIIREYDYAPDERAKFLSEGKSNLIALIIPDIRSAFFQQVIAGATQVAENAGYDILLYNTDEQPIRQHRILKALRRKSLSGVIMTPAHGPDEDTPELVSGLEREGVSIALLDRDLPDKEHLPLVLADNVNSSYEAVNVLIGEGHRKIALVSGDSCSRPLVERRAGYVKALQEAGIPIHDEWIAYCDHSIDTAYVKIKAMMESEDPPTAIFSSNDMMTMGCLRYITENNLEIGSDISIISFDDIEVLRTIRYKLSVVDQQPQQIGEQATRLLLRCLDGATEGPMREIVPSKLILRGSEKIRTVQQA